MMGPGSYPYEDIGDVVYPDAWSAGVYPEAWSAEPFSWWEQSPPLSDEEALEEIGDVVADYLARNARKEWKVLRRSCFAFQPAFAPGGHVVGWSAPPHPIDVIPSVDPRASKKQQARAVLFDFYHDDALRSWADDGNVKDVFGVKHTEDTDPTLLIQAYENPNDPVWKKKPLAQAGNATWKKLDDAVQSAIKRRVKLGPLPKASYSTDPIVIYYYDHDRMKKIVYPRYVVPTILLAPPQSSNYRFWWRADGNIFTYETQDPKKIEAERKKPGSPTSCLNRDKCRGEGHWDDEGFDWNKDMPGNVEAVFSTIMEIVGAVLQVIPGIGTAIGTALMIGGAVLAAVLNALDQALTGGDVAAALTNLGVVIVQASAKGMSAAGVQAPPEAVKALGQTIQSIGAAVEAGQKRKDDWATIWGDIAKKANSFTKIGDNEAHVIEAILGDTTAGHVFMKGFEAGKLTDPPTIAAIAEIVKATATFSDPKIVNLFLLGAGIGYISRTQEGGNRGIIRSVGGAAHPSQKGPPGPARASKAAAAPTAPSARGDFAGQIFIGGRQAARDDLESFALAVLGPRYGIHGRHFVGAECPPGFDAVMTGGEIACAYRGRAACLAGQLDERGLFVCTTRDFDCPPGMSTRRGSPANWCFPGGSYATGQASPPPPPPDGPPDWSFPALGCPHGYWRDDLSGGKCRPIAPPLPAPRTSYYAY